MSNTTWSNYEKTGHLTPKVRQAVSVAFGWPLSWPEVASQDDLTGIFTKLGELEGLVRRLQQTVKDLTRSATEGREDLNARLDRLERRAGEADGESAL